MFTLFNPPYRRYREPLVLPMFDYYIRQTNTECSKLLKFYSENTYNAKSTDRWLKFLITIQQYLDLAPELLVEVIRDNSPRFCNAFGLVSPVNSSKIQMPGTMYNRNTPELMISVEYPFSVSDCVKRYKEMSSVRVVSHDFSDFSYGLCNGDYSSGEQGLAIFTVDLAMMAVMFQQWCKHDRFIKERGIHKPITEFIAKYIWPAIIFSHMDNVLFNRLINVLDNRPSQPAVSRHSFYLVDYGNHFDQQFRLLLEKMRKQPTGWIQRLESIPSLQYGNYYQAMLYPDTAPTRYVRWAMVLSKLKMLEFILKTDNYLQNRSLNIGDRVTIQRELRILLNDRSFELTVPESFMNRIKWVYAQVNEE